MGEGDRAFAQRLRDNLAKNDPETVNTVNEILLLQLRELVCWVGECSRQGKGRLKGCAVIYRAQEEHKKLIADVTAAKADRRVFRLDLSIFSSKYRSETEQSLRDLLVKAEQNQWILFFDEADCLLQPGTEVQDGDLSQAIQNLRWLLDQIRDFEGLIILDVQHAHWEPFFEKLHPDISLTLSQDGDVEVG